MPDQLRPGHGNTCCSHKLGHAAIKLSGLHLKPEEIRVVREEIWVEIGLDGCEINSVIFSAGVVTHHCKTEQCEQEHGEKLGWKVVSLQTVGPRILSHKQR